MKKITSLLLLFVSTILYSQSSGITYQAIIYNPNGEVIPGYNNANSPMANKSICLQFSIIDASLRIEYQEKITTTTDEFGMVNLIIGTGIQNGGYATSFSNIYWSVTQKSLKVALDSNGQCSNFLEISNQPFTSVPFAFAANSAENVTGVVPIENGGTNAITVLGAKTNLGLQNVDNTRDLDKPISTATQTALNLKENLANKSSSITTDATSTVKYPTVKSVKDYVDASSTDANAAITNEAIIRAAADTVLTNNLAAEVTNRTNADITLTNNLNSEVTRATTAENTLTANLAAEVTRATTAEATKENLSNKSINITTDGASDTKYPSVKSVKTYVDLSNATLTTNLAAEVTRATTAENTLTANLAAEVTRATTAEAFKENSANKSIDVTFANATNVKFPTELAVKTFVNNTIASANATNANLTGPITSSGNTTSINSQTGTGSTFVMNTSPTLVSPVLGVATATSVTSPLYVSTPQALASGSVITWNPATGLNAAVTLNQNSTLSFSATPVAGTYGTLIITQDATGGRTLTLPSTTNKVLGSSSTTTIDLSSAANAQDILNFYYDGTNCYWNIGQGYGVATPPVITSLASGVTGTLPVANGGTGATTLTGIVKGNGTSALTAAVAGTDFQAPLTLTTTGSGAATLSGTTLNIPAVSATVNANTITGTVAIVNGGTGSSTKTTAFDALSPMTTFGDLIYGGASGTGTRLARGTDGQVLVLTSGVPTWAAAPATGDSVTEVADEISATVNQVSFTLTQTPAIKSKVKMYINGIRITNTAYTISGSTLTYVPANNGAYSLIVGDRIQFDYYF